MSQLNEGDSPPALTPGSAETEASSRALLLFAYVVSAAMACAYLLNWWVALNDPFSLNYEAPILWASMRLAEGQNMYPADGLIHQPWSAILYPPLYMALGAIPVKLFGISYVWHRGLSMISMLITVVAMYRIVNITLHSRLLAITATAFFCNFEMICIQSCHTRPDMLATALSLLMIERYVTAARGDGEPADKNADSVRSYWQTALVGTLAFAAKQQAITFMLALALYALTVGKKKVSAFMVAFWVCSIGLLFVALETMSQGGFMANLLLLKVVKPDPFNVIVNIATLDLDWIKVVGGFLIIPLGVVFAPGRRFPTNYRLPLLIFVISAASMSYTMGIPAASRSHMIPVLFAFAWLVAGSLQFLPRWTTAIVLAACLVNVPRLAEFGLQFPKALPYEKRSAEALARYDLKDKVVLTDDWFINYMTGSKPAIVDCATFLNVWKARGQNPEEMLANIGRKSYAAVIINSVDVRGHGNVAWWPPQIVDAVHKNYHRQETLNCSGWEVDVYLPGPPAAGTHPATGAPPASR